MFQDSGPRLSHHEHSQPPGWAARGRAGSRTVLRKEMGPGADLGVLPG